MRNLKLIIAIVGISIASTFSASATETNPVESTKQLRSQIISILGKKVTLQIEKTGTAEISFLINNKNEIVVISVNSKLSSFNTFVKNKLNYKKIDTKGINRGEIYKMPIKILAS
jgi:hypothetical protein